MFDPTYVYINDNQLPFEERAVIKAKYINELYPDAVEENLPNTLKPRGGNVQITYFVDTNHGGDQVTRISRTGILTSVNKAPIIWYIKIKYRRNENLWFRAGIYAISY